ncbi:MAG: NAD(P)-dependent oxidoreductase, partial [Gammaproteobacteria bacterium]|nr:NAD(P)-dependent oxidoreductase [Gammaproteobacteria bacterium]
MSKQQVAFIGLGVMGYPMAGHLANAGYQTRVYNRTTAKAEQWCRDYQGDFAGTPREAAEDADFIFMCVGNDDDLRSVVYGDDGVLAGCKESAILVDHTTASANVAREVAGKSPVPFLDAPVSGGQAGAENGVLTVMIGGDQSSFDAARPVIMSYARAAELMGSVGAGQLTKMVNQICIAGLVQGLSEGLNFAQRVGLDGHKVVDVISKGAAGSWQMENRGNTMLDDEFEFGFAVDW